MPVSHLLLLMFICLVWAGNFIAAAWAVRIIEPVTFTVVRFGMVLVLLLPLLRFPVQRQWPVLIGCCLTMGTIHFGLVFFAWTRMPFNHLIW
ncbi:MAG: EamA family transporter, partial [Wenzhouxiangella sp.]